jgi:hypothetical protein
MVTLLGGIHTFSGPIVGSILFYLIKDIIVRYTQYWLIWFGSIVVFLVLVFRGGRDFFAERVWPLLNGLRVSRRSNSRSFLRTEKLKYFQVVSAADGMPNKLKKGAPSIIGEQLRQNHTHQPPCWEYLS